MMAAVSAMSHASCDDAELYPAYLRSRARFFRDLADEETDREKAALYREVADDFDRDADARESGTNS
jgi:hypothetical protein